MHYINENLFKYSVFLILPAIDCPILMTEKMPKILAYILIFSCNFHNILQIHHILRIFFIFSIAIYI
jgi:hypothetical protein